MKGPLRRGRKSDLRVPLGMLGAAGLSALFALVQSQGTEAHLTVGQQAGTASVLAQQQTLAEGITALRAGRLDTAEKDLLRVLSGGEKTAFVYNNLGIVYQLRGDHPRALVQFRKAILVQPDYAPAHALLGSSLLAQGKVKEATRELETAVKLQPRDPVAHFYLAKAYDVSLKPLMAADENQIVRELSPQEPEYIYQSGKAYLKLAAWCYQQIVRLQPGSARRYQSLAENYRKEGQLELAARVYRNATAADPTLPEVHLRLAEILWKQGNLGEARKEVEKELSLVPESVDALALKDRLDREATGLSKVPQR